MMADALRRRGELHARLPEHRRRVDQSRRTVADALATTDAWYVALSGGKDSTCLLDLVRQQAQDTPAVFSDDEWNLPETSAYIDGVSNCQRIAARIRHADWFVSWVDGAERLPEGTQWVETAHNDGLQTYARQQGYGGAFLGLRAEESRARKLHLATMGPLFFCRGAGVWQCNPLAWWTVDDVWAYIVARGLRYNAAYDRLAALGVPLEHQRVGPLAVERVLHYGQQATLKAGWPDLYNRFAAAYPEVRGYV